MKQLWILAFLAVLLGAASPAQQIVDRHYQDGQRLFGEKNFAAALQEFKDLDSWVPNDPQVDSWIGACLNELGRHAEAKQYLEEAIQVLRDKQRLAGEENQPVPEIAIGYFTLLARIQLNLGEFEQAIATIDSYPVQDDGSSEAAKAKQAIDIERQALKTKLVALGSECLNMGDLDCARLRFTQGETVLPAMPSVREWVAREFLRRAEKAPGATEEEKAKRAELYMAAVQASRIWLEEAGSASTDAQRTLAKALLGSKNKEGYEEAIRILTVLRDGEDPAQKDGSIQRDLAVAHAGLEHWELSLASASQFIELNPDDPLGQGFCLRSFAQYQLGNCQEAIHDGRYCKNADGSPRTLKYVDTCQQRLSKQETERAQAAQEAREAKEERQCSDLYGRIKWARSSPDQIPLDDLVKAIVELKSEEAECKRYLDALERKSSGNGYASPTPTLCAGGAKTAGFPLNLSQRSKTELQSLQAKTKQFLTLCRPFLDTSQIAGVEGGLLKVEKALE